MGKTTFSDTPPLGTIVTAAFLNAVNTHRHTGEAVDGAGALDYAVDSGAANAYVVTLSPALSGHVTGMPIWFKATNANTGASTVNVNGLGAVAIKKHGSQALAAGDIAAGQIVGIAYDGTNYQMIGSSDTFPAVLEANGYQKLPSGVIIQWGQGTTTGTGVTATSKSVTFPITFPTAVLAVFATSRKTADSTSGFYPVAAVPETGITLSGCTIVLDVLGSHGNTVFFNQSVPFNYLAIGY